MKRKLIFGFLGASILMGSQFTTANVFANENIAVVAEESIGLENNVIKMRGRDLQSHVYKGFDIKFNTKEQKIEIANMLGSAYQIHDYFNEKYMGIKLIGQDGIEKASVELQGTDKINKALKINGVKFEYGDTLEIYHREAHKSDNTKAPFIVEGKVEGQQNNLRTHKYKLTANGLREVFNYPNVIKVLGLPVQGHKNPHGFHIEFDTENQKLKITNVYGIQYGMNSNFGSNDYIKIELIGENGQVKETLDLKGNIETRKALDLNGVDFKYRDTIKIHHEEGVDRYEVTNLEGQTGRTDYEYKITAKGLVSMN